MTFVVELSRKQFQPAVQSIDLITLIHSTVVVIPAQIIGMNGPVGSRFQRIGFFHDIAPDCKELWPLDIQ